MADWENFIHRNYYIKVFHKLYFRIDAFLLKTFAYTTTRVWAFCYFYDWINPDPRRIARPDYMVAAGVAGGFISGVVTNPIDLIFARM